MSYIILMYSLILFKNLSFVLRHWIRGRQTISSKCNFVYFMVTIQSNKNGWPPESWSAFSI